MEWRLAAPTQAFWIAIAAVLAAAVALSLLMAVARRLVRGTAQRLAARTATSADDLLVWIFDRSTIPLALFLALWGAPILARALAEFRSEFRRVALLALVLQAGVWLNAAITFTVRRSLSSSTPREAQTVTAMTALGFAFRLLLFVILGIAGLSIAGIHVTPLIAGLGIGGLAIALALQTVLRDLLGALAIILGKPFLVGDVIHADQFIGTVTHVGLRTTRIRNLPGDELTIPNNKLLESPIRNYSRIQQRRMVQSIAVAFGTDPEKLAAIPAMLREAIAEAQPVRFDRAHLKGFTPWGIEFEAVYFVERSDFNLMMDVQQRINLAVLRRFAERGIELGYPGASLPGELIRWQTQERA